tara:strand:- start:448 stop:756 length:309 start_codon:yes stop_codon:yes gene_type:complete
MKITQEQLKQIIKEELEATMRETQVTGMGTPFDPASGPGAGADEIDVANIGGGLEVQLAQSLAKWGYEKVKQMLDSMAGQADADKEARGPGSVFQASRFGKK